jgi:hypothetical protein
MKMHRVHATCLQTGVPTGRMAFENPNLQCIRHSFDYVPIPEKTTSDVRNKTLEVLGLWWLTSWICLDL